MANVPQEMGTVGQHGAFSDSIWKYARESLTLSPPLPPQRHGGVMMDKLVVFPLQINFQSCCFIFIFIFKLLCEQLQIKFRLAYAVIYTNMVQYESTKPFYTM